MGTLRYLITHHWKALTVFVMAACVVAFFAGRVVMHQVWRHDPARAEFVIEPWMTPRFVGMRTGVPPELLFETLDINGREARRFTLSEIAEDKGMTVQEVGALLEAAANQAKAERDARRDGDRGPRAETRDPEQDTNP